MKRKEKIQQSRLAQMEDEFRALLIPCLEQCARGRWGLFGTFNYLGEDAKYWNWPEADRLRDLATSITAILNESGGRNPLCDEFLKLCSTHGPNDPGEPKLASTFLEKARSEYVR